MLRVRIITELSLNAHYLGLLAGAERYGRSVKGRIPRIRCNTIKDTSQMVRAGEQQVNESYERAAVAVKNEADLIDLGHHDPECPARAKLDVEILDKYIHSTDGPAFS
jgi:hypothetical protein